MPLQPPKIDARLRAALLAIDQTRLKFDQAIKDGDETAAADLLNAIKKLAAELDDLGNANPDAPVAGKDKAST